MPRGLVAALGAIAAATPCSGRPLVRAATASARPVGLGGRARRRRLVVVRAGGPPSANALFLAFVLPLSLFIGTLVTAARVADDLDERFLREMEINRAIMEEDDDASDEGIAGAEYDEGEEDEEEEEAPVDEKEPVVVGAAAPRTRNRPRRQVQ